MQQSAANLFPVSRVPDRTALQNPLCNPAPFSDLAIVGAHPVDGDGSEPALLAIAGKTEPAVAVLRSDSPARSSLGPAISKDALFDQEDCVLDRRAALHFAPFYRRWVYHPHLPKPPASVEESAVAGVFGSLDLHAKIGKVLVQLNARPKPRRDCAALGIFGDE